MTLFETNTNKPENNHVTRSASEAQSSASSQGREFENLVAGKLKFMGWSVLAMRWRPPGSTVTVDIRALDPDGSEVWIECKGSYVREETAGIRRGDTIKKAMGVAAYLKHVRPDRPKYVLWASHRPIQASAVDLLRVALESELFDGVEYV